MGTKTTKKTGSKKTTINNTQKSKISPSDLSVILSGPFLTHSGFSKMNRELAFGLTKRGVTVKLDICDNRVEIDDKTKASIDRMTQVKVKPKTPKIYSMTMPSIISSDGPRILFTMMESSKGLHKDYAEKMNLASEIWVPTTHMTDIMQDAGVCSPVHIVPLGVDKNVFSQASGVMPLTKNARGFRFLSVSWWGPRKGFDILIKAFVGEFAEDEDVCLIISSRSQDSKPSSKIAEEIKQIIASTGNEEHAPVILHSKVTTDKELASLYNACDAFVLASRGEGFSLPICFSPETAISISDGFKKINEIKNGDIVISHSGKQRKCLETMKRYYDGEMIEISGSMNNTPIQCTPEHPFLAVKKKWRRSDDKRHASIAPTWIVSKDLQKGDLLVVPIQNNISQPTLEIDLANILSNVEFDDTHVWSKFSNGPSGITVSKLSTNSGVSERQVHKVMEAEDRSSKISGISESKRILVVQAMEKLERDKFSNVKVNRIIKLDKDFGTLLGFYASKGSVNENSVSFAFNVKDTEYHNEVKRLMYDIFGIEKCWENRSHVSLAYKLIFSSSISSKVFESLIGKEILLKKIKQVLLNAGEDFKKGFVEAFHCRGECMIETDASLNQSFSTYSAILAYQIWQMLLSFGIAASIKSYQRQNKNIEYRISYPDEKLNSILCDGYFLSEIRSIKTQAYRGLVYNLEVENDNSYCANGYAVHNCEAASCGLPVITTNCTAQETYLDDSNAYLLDPECYEKANPQDGRSSNIGRWCKYYENQMFPVFGGKSVRKLGEIMRDVYENRSDAQVKANVLTSKVRSSMTWDNTIDAIIERLSAIAAKQGEKA